jgi:hypothetical protein
VPEGWSRDRIIQRALCSLCLVLDIFATTRFCARVARSSCNSYSEHARNHGARVFSCTRHFRSAHTTRVACRPIEGHVVDSRIESSRLGRLLLLPLSRIAVIPLLNHCGRKSAGRMAHLYLAAAAFGVVAAACSDTAAPGDREPQLRSIIPDTVVVGAVPASVVVTGSRFDSRSRILVDSLPVTTTFIAETALRILLPFTDTTRPRRFALRVTRDSIAGAGPSSLTLTLATPKPTITSTGTATRVITMSASDTVTIFGTGFSQWSLVSPDGVIFNGPLIISPTSVRYTFPGRTLGAGLYQVRVFNLPPGGGTSNTFDLVLQNRPSP